MSAGFWDKGQNARCWFDSFSSDVGICSFGLHHIYVDKVQVVKRKSKMVVISFANPYQQYDSDSFVQADVAQFCWYDFLTTLKTDLVTKKQCDAQLPLNVNERGSHTELWA